MSKRVYVAGPYTKGDVIVNCREAIKAGDELRKLGFTPFIPHLNYSWHLLFPHEPDFWYEYDNEWLPLCDYLLRLPGESTGSDNEVALAKSLGIPCFTSIAKLSRFSIESALLGMEERG